ncbi:MAG: ABC transporter substrate-binding protein [Fibrobacterales bacterium]
MKWLITLVLCLSLQSIWAAESPLTLIKKKDIELQKLLKKKDAPKETIKQLINSIFDFQKMGQKSLSSTTWKKQPETKKKEFVANFKEMVENASIKKLEVYEADSTVYEKPKIKKGRAKITAHMWNKGTESVLVYKLEEVNGVWMAWDLIIDDLSTVRNYREQFRKIIKDKGFDELLKILKDKALENK